MTSTLKEKRKQKQASCEWQLPLKSYDRTTIYASCLFNVSGSTQMVMIYDKENRLAQHQQGASTATFLYSGETGMKMVEIVDGATTTLVWDGPDYLQGRS